jgi:glutamyl-tRNA synthetase
MTLQELEQSFDIARVSKAPAFFDFKKMLWISNSYIKKMEDQAYLQFVKPFVTIDLQTLNHKIDELLLIFKSQLAYAEEINKLIADTFLSTDFDHLSQEMYSIIKSDNFQKNINALKQILTALSDDLNLQNANEVVNAVKAQTGLTGKDLYLPVRFAAIGKEHGPEMNKILSVVGKNRILENIAKLIH